MADFFIRRPIVAMVIAILTIIVGLISLMRLPVAEYPPVSPTMIQATTTYRGAAAEALGQPGRIKTAQRGSDDGQLLRRIAVDQREHQRHRLFWRRWQLRANQFVGAAECLHSLADDARLE